MPRRGDQQHNFPSVPEQLSRGGRIGIRRVRAADQTGTLRDIAFDPNEFRCARLAGELADEWVDYAETSRISRKSVSLGRRAIRNFCTRADLLLGRNAHRASLADSIPTSQPLSLNGSEPFHRLPSRLADACCIRGQCAGADPRRAQHDQRPVTAALCRLVDGAKGVAPAAAKSSTSSPAPTNAPLSARRGRGRISWMPGS